MQYGLPSCVAVVGLLFAARSEHTLRGYVGFLVATASKRAPEAILMQVSLLRGATASKQFTGAKVIRSDEAKTSGGEALASTQAR